jgi:hypothetical protein
MTFDDDVLNRLAPALPWQPDWANVLERAGTHERRRLPQLRAKRRLILVLAVLAAVLIPLIALGGENEWWFLDGHAPTPTSPPVVVKEGSWDVHPWELVAYPTADGLCYSVMPTGSKTEGAGSCTSFAGVARTNETKATQNMTITYMSGRGYGLPVWIAGPVIDSASQVEIRFGNGTDLRLSTFAAPASLGRVRFYAAQLPKDVTEASPGPGQIEFIRSVAGLDNDGNVVACLAPATAVDGISRLSDCK